MGAAELFGAVPKTTTQGAINRGEAADRRRHAQVHNYWRSLKGERPFPSIWDLDPFEIADAGPNSVMLDLTKDLENPEIFVGDALRYDANSQNDKRKQADAQALIASVLSNYRAVLARSGPIAFQDNIPTEGRRTLACFGSLFPFSSTGQAIDYVFGMISWQEEESEAPALAAVPVAAVPDAPAPDPVPAEVAAEETAVEEAVVEDDPFEDTLAEITLPASWVEAAAAKDLVAAVEATAAEEPAAEPVVPEEAAIEEPAPAELEIEVEIVEEAVAEEAGEIDEPEEEEVDDSLYAALDVALGVPEEPVTHEVSEEAVSDEVIEDAAPVAEAPEMAELEAAAPIEEPVQADLEAAQPEAQAIDPVLGAPVPDAVEPQEGSANLAAIGKAMFAVVKRLTVADNVVSFRPPARDAEPEPPADHEPIEEIVSEAAPVDEAPAELQAVEPAIEEVLAAPEVVEAVAEEAPAEPEVVVPAIEEALAEPELVQAVAEEAPAEPAAAEEPVEKAPTEPEAVEIPVEEAAVEAGPEVEPEAVEVAQIDEVAVDVASDVGAPEAPVFMEMLSPAAMQSEIDAEAARTDRAEPEIAVESAVEDEVVEPEPAPANTVYVDMLSSAAARWEEEAELEERSAAASAPDPEPEHQLEPELAQVEVEVAPTASGPVPAGLAFFDLPDRSTEEAPRHAASGLGGDALRRQLSVAQALATAVPDDGHHNRSTLYVAVGHAYDFALAALDEPEAYGAILEEAGLEIRGQGSMTPIVELVFGPGYDRKRLHEFAGLLSRAHRAHLPAGCLAPHLEFLEAALAIVTAA